MRFRPRALATYRASSASWRAESTSVQLLCESSVAPALAVTLFDLVMKFDYP